MNIKISGLILAKNEEEMISDCIKQLKFVDEVIVIDQNSTDETHSIAQSLGAKVYKSDSENFAQNRNTLKLKSSAEWLLYIDADERLSEAAIAEILEIISSSKAKSAYYFPRKNIMLGKWLKHGGWWPDYVPRLFKSNTLSSWVGSVHESPIVNGSFGYADNPITHLTARSVTTMLAKSIKWAKIEAELNAGAGAPKVNILKVCKALGLVFIKKYVFKMGILDAKVGLIQAMYQSLHRAIVLTYLWEIQNKSKKKLKGYVYE